MNTDSNTDPVSDNHDDQGAPRPESTVSSFGDGETASVPSPRQGSGGPKTAEGKKKVSQNAVTFGIHSLSPVAGGESEEEWVAFYQGCRETFQPRGMILEELVSELSMIMWRKRRIIRAENASINAQYDAIDDPASYPSPTDDDVSAPEVETEDNPDWMMPGIRTLEALQSPEVDWDVIESDWECALEVLRYFEGGEDFLLTGEPWTPALFVEHVKKVAEPNDETYQELLSSVLEKARDHLGEVERRTRADRAEVERRARDARAEVARRASEAMTLRKHLERAAILPAPATEERLQRAEAHLGRRFAQVLSQIELLQRACSDEDVPPPLRIQVTEQ